MTIPARLRANESIDSWVRELVALAAAKWVASAAADNVAAATVAAAVAAAAVAAAAAATVQTMEIMNTSAPTPRASGSTTTLPRKLTFFKLITLLPVIASPLVEKKSLA